MLVTGPYCQNVHINKTLRSSLLPFLSLCNYLFQSFYQNYRTVRTLLYINSHDHTHTHTRTFAVASLTQCQCSVPLVSVLQTHLHIKKGIYPGKHSMCLYKTGGCLLFMCELVIGLGGGWSHCSVHWPPSKDVPIHSNLAPSITAPACSKIQLSSTN